MVVNKQLLVTGIVFLLLSSLLFVSGFLFVSKVSFLSVAFIVGFLLFLGHQGFMWWILYQFATTKKRMNNKLHMLNKIALVGTSIFTCLYLLLAPFIRMEIATTINPWTSLLVILVMSINVVYQENNTHNFFLWNMHKKTNQTKKELNQSIGFGMAWITINFLWLSIAFSIPLSLFSLMFLFLLTIQSSLTYTTYGQSKYWNFAYEVILLTQLTVTSLYFNQGIFFAISAMLTVGFMLRQWIDLKYKSYSRVIGITLYMVLSGVLFLNLFQWKLTEHNPSILIRYPLLIASGVFLIVYVIDSPKFYEKIFVK